MKKKLIYASAFIIILIITVLFGYYQRSKNSPISLTTVVVSTRDRSVTDERIIEIAKEVGAESYKKGFFYNFIRVKLPPADGDALKKLSIMPEITEVVSINIFGKKVDPVQINFKSDIGDAQIKKIIDEVGGTIVESSYTSDWVFTVKNGFFDGTRSVENLLKKLSNYPEINASENHKYYLQ